MKAASALFFPSASAFGPYLVKRSWTSAGFKPLLGSTPNFVRISATVGLADPVASSVGMNSSSTHSVRGSVLTWYVHPRPEKRPRNRCNRLKGGTDFPSSRGEVFQPGVACTRRSLLSCRAQSRHLSLLI